MLAQVFDKFSMTVYLEFQRDFLTEVFCINKEKPELLCYANCYIKEKLENDNNDKDLIVNLTAQKLVHFITPQIDLNLDAPDDPFTLHSHFYAEAPGIHIPDPTFHPPDILAPFS